MMYNHKKEHLIKKSLRSPEKVKKQLEEMKKNADKKLKVQYKLE